LLRELRKAFDGIEALDSISFAIRDGEVVGLMGPNGAGKTTLFNVISGLVLPDSGEIMLQGANVVGLAPHRICRLGLGRTFQYTRLFDSLTVHENMVLASEATHARRREEALLEATRILGMLRLEGHREVLASALSTGYRKVAELARCLAGRPKLLLLDEPTAGLAGPLRQLVLKVLADYRREGHSILIIEHSTQTMREICDRLFLLDRGRLALQGSVEEVLKNPQTEDVYLGIHAGSFA